MTAEPRYTLIAYNHAYGDGESSDFVLEQNLTRAEAIERGGKHDHAGREVTIVEGAVRYAENFTELEPDEGMIREVRDASRKLDAEKRAKQAAVDEARDRETYERLRAKFTLPTPEPTP